MLLLRTRVAAGGGPGLAARFASAWPARDDRVVAARGEATLQEAADDLVARALVLVMAFRSSEIGPVSSETPQPDPAMLEFLHDLGEIAAAGGDIRQRLFG